MTIQFDYLKRINSQYYAGLTEQYIRELLLQGISESKVLGVRKKVIAAVKIFIEIFGDINIGDVTVEQVRKVDESMTEYADRYRRAVMVEFCKMVCHYQKSETLYEEYIGVRMRKCRDVSADQGVFLFKEEMERYMEFKASQGLSETSRKNLRIWTISACKLLHKNRNITSLDQIDCECVEYLQEYYQQFYPKVYMNFLGAFRGFVKFATGFDVYSERLEKSNVIYKIPEGPQKEVFLDDLHRYLEDERERNLHENHIKAVRTRVANCYLKVCEVYGAMFPKDIDYHIFRGIQTKFGRLKQVTVQGYLSALNHMLQFCYGVAPLKAANLKWSIGKPRRSFLDPDDWRVLHDTADPSTRMILVLGGMLGLRRAEIAKANLDDIDGCDIRVMGKGHGTGKEVWLEMDDDTLDELDRYLEYRDELCRQYPDYSNGNLIVSVYRNRLVPATVDVVYDRLKAICNKNGIKASCHTLRRLFGTTLIENGEDLDVVKDLMRHEDISTTIECYKRDNKIRKRAARRRVGRTLLG